MYFDSRIAEVSEGIRSLLNSLQRRLCTHSRNFAPYEDTPCQN
jgi:hypothetical protein